MNNVQKAGVDMTIDVVPGSDAVSTRAGRPAIDEMASRRQPLPGIASYIKPYTAGGGHSGVHYIEFMRRIGETLSPRSYLEIGTLTGHSLQQFDCDALCIDPRFCLMPDVLRNRKRTFFFQSTSDAFFRDEDVSRYLPGGVDLAFLDGLHHFEATLRDFINVEKSCHGRSVVMIHDCLPLDLPMTARVQCEGMWTGDVWRLLPIFKAYRPDLRVSVFDCPPTGLVVCTRLDPRSTVLSENYHRIIDEAMNVPLDREGLDRIGRVYPYFDTVRLAAAPGDLPLFLG